MRRYSIRAVLVATWLGVTAVSVLAMWGLASQMANSVVSSEIASRVSEQEEGAVSLAAEYLLFPRRSEYVDTLDARLSASQITAIINATGATVWGRTPDPARVLSAVTDALPASTLSNRTASIYVALPVAFDPRRAPQLQYEAELLSAPREVRPDELIGTVLIDIGPIGAEVLAFRTRSVSLGSVLICLTTALLALLIDQLIGRPITGLRRAVSANRIGPDARVIARRLMTPREISRLADALVRQDARVSADRQTLKTRVEERTEELERLVERTRDLILAASRQADHESRQIVAEIHDDLSTAHLHLKRQLERFRHAVERDGEIAEDRRALAQRISHWITLIDDANRVARSIMERYRTDMVYYLGVDAALRDRVLTLARSRPKLRAYFINRAPQHLENLSVGQAEEVRKILQEAVRNVVRHSRASRVSVTVDNEDDSLLFVVTDDGGGFDKADNLTGFGLEIMGQRAMAIDADLEIGRYERGTRVRLRVPLLEMLNFDEVVNT